MVDFAGEQGHGEGPTQEFFSLLCAEILSIGQLWRDSRGGNGFFPLDTSAGSKGEADKSLNRRMFRTLGRCEGYNFVNAVDMCSGKQGV
jgi:hypothetical protein